MNTEAKLKYLIKTIQHLIKYLDKNGHTEVAVMLRESLEIVAEESTTRK